jgi:hypothetical protein
VSKLSNAAVEAASDEEDTTIDDDLLRFCVAMILGAPPEQRRESRYAASCYDAAARLLFCDGPANQRFRLLMMEDVQRLQRAKARGARSETLARDAMRALLYLQDLELQTVIAEKQKLGVKAPVKDAEDQVGRLCVNRR